ncbi:hypothetical protein HPB47_015532 [Ixodes persulcatus]|uniref:Uncharacterized protein n=1 Tax=Ixodes persulcatus TaxID=34615 RepID=A0AC60QVV6_IXOPE|nr:hypothetical protein HPB47_015532 [Ixodes persulcatus]
MAAAREAALRLPPLPTVRDLLRMYRIRAMRQLSQNFLMDPKLTRRLVKAAGKIRDHHVIEVGPGPGCLTRPLLELGARQVVVIEKDPRFFPSLQVCTSSYMCGKAFKSSGFPIPCSGIRLQCLLGYTEGQMELGVPWEGPPPPVHVVGNLPFSVSTPLLVRWLRMASRREGPFLHGRVPLTLTFQKEVAERIVAPVMHIQRCRLSVMCQAYCSVQHQLTLSGGSFFPKPDVDVGVVRLVPLVEPVIQQPFDLVEKVCNCLFNGRQKYLSNGLNAIQWLGEKAARREPNSRSRSTPRRHDHVIVSEARQLHSCLAAKIARMV